MDRSGQDVAPAVVDACRRGDREALRELYEAYKDRVYSLALHFFHGDAATAADVTQQVFLKLIEGMTSFRGDSALSTWLYRVTIRACLDRTRSAKSERATSDDARLAELPAAGASAEDVLARGEVAAQVRAAIAALPPKLRFAILLRYVDDLSYADMAAALNCSLGTVASRLSRGHRLLASRLSSLRAALADAPGPAAPGLFAEAPAGRGAGKVAGRDATRGSRG
jgi:RNA polymerase sigma-70 factor (ECF subfamily)